MFLPVDEAVVRGDDLKGEAQLGDLGEKLGDQGAEGHQDVGIVLFQLPGVGQREGGQPVVKMFAGGQVGPEGVTGEQDLLFLEVGHHGVRPVEHGGLQEGQVVSPRGQLAAGLDLDKGPILFVVAEQPGLAHGRAENLFRLDPIDDLGQSPGMIHFHVVGDDIINLGRVHDLGHPGHHLGHEFLFDRVNERDVVVDNQIGVIRGAIFGEIAVKIPNGPINGAHPVNLGGQFYRHINLRRY